MDNDLITAGQISDEFTLMSLFFRADLVVKLEKTGKSREVTIRVKVVAQIPRY